jgi:hypothetical protein
MRYTQNFVLMSAISAIVLALGGCASIRSISLSPGSHDVPPQGGMVYYLPMQRLKLTLTVVAASDAKQNPNRTVEVSPTAILADTGARYVAQYRRNQIGSNLLTVSANADGLLSGEARGSTTQNVAEFLGEIASNANITMNIQAPHTAAPSCAGPGTYEWMFDVPLDDKSEIHQQMKDCGIIVVARSVGAVALPQTWKSVGQTMRGAGYFYRQKRPVEVTVSSGEQCKVFYLSMVDSASPIEFLPIPKTVFATTTWKVTFENGSPTLYDINAGGDVLGLVKLPADVVSAYSKAVLAGLKEKKGVAGAEVEYLQQINALAAQQAQYALCRAAVQSGDNEKIKTACQ